MRGYGFPEGNHGCYIELTHLIERVPGESLCRIEKSERV